MGRRGKRSAARSAKRAAVFHKTKMCPVFVTGQPCPRGDLCPFAHHEEELKAPPDLSCTKLCRTWLAGEVCLNEKCRHAHSMEELRTPMLNTANVCQLVNPELEDIYEEGSDPEEYVDFFEIGKDDDTETLSSISMGPDTEVVVYNTFITLRPTTPDSRTARRVRSTPPVFSSSNAATPRRSCSKLSATSSDDSTAASSDLESDSPRNLPSLGSFDWGSSSESSRSPQHAGQRSWLELNAFMPPAQSLRPQESDRSALAVH